MDAHFWHKNQLPVIVGELGRTSARDVELVNAIAEIVDCGLGRHCGGSHMVSWEDRQRAVTCQIMATFRD